MEAAKNLCDKYGFTQFDVSILLQLLNSTNNKSMDNEKAMGNQTIASTTTSSSEFDHAKYPTRNEFGLAPIEESTGFLFKICYKIMLLRIMGEWVNLQLKETVAN